MEQHFPAWEPPQVPHKQKQLVLGLLREKVIASLSGRELAHVRGFCRDEFSAKIGYVRRCVGDCGDDCALSFKHREEYNGKALRWEKERVLSINVPHASELIDDMTQWQREILAGALCHEEYETICTWAHTIARIYR